MNFGFSCPLSTQLSHSSVKDPKIYRSAGAAQEGGNRKKRGKPERLGGDKDERGFFIV